MIKIWSYSELKGKSSSTTSSTTATHEHPEDVVWIHSAHASGTPLVYLFHVFSRIEPLPLLRIWKDGVSLSDLFELDFSLLNFLFRLICVFVGMPLDCSFPVGLFDHRFARTRIYVQDFVQILTFALFQLQLSVSQLFTQSRGLWGKVLNFWILSECFVVQLHFQFDVTLLEICLRVLRVTLDC